MLTQSLNDARAAEAAALSRAVPVSSEPGENESNADRKIDAETEAEIAQNTLVLKELEA